MDVVVVFSVKGGPGKSTIATNLAVASALKDHSTLIIDTDQESESAYDWYCSRDNQTNPIVKQAKSVGEFKQIMKAAEECGFDKVYVDTSGKESTISGVALQYASFCIAPCAIGGFNMRSAAKTAEILRNVKVKAAFVINDAEKRTNEVSETRSILSPLGLPVAPCEIRHLKAFRLAAQFNSTVLEDEPRGEAAKDIKTLYEWLNYKLQPNKLEQALEDACNE